MGKKILIIVLAVSYYLLADSLKEKDMLITINKTNMLKFDTYNSMHALWYNPFIIKNSKKSKIENYNYENGSELSLKISPNRKFILLDEISKGYVYVSETDSILQENYFCVVLDIDSARIIFRSQNDCDSEWNKSNQLISNNEIIFEAP